NKTDLLTEEAAQRFRSLEQDDQSLIFLSAREKTGMDELQDHILQKINLHQVNTEEVLVSNIRHLDALQKTSQSLESVLNQIDSPVSSDFLAADIKLALHYLGEITGQVTTDDLLENIFSKFCIGK